MVNLSAPITTANNMSHTLGDEILLFQFSKWNIESKNEPLKAFCNTWQRQFLGLHPKNFSHYQDVYSAK